MRLSFNFLYILFLRICKSAHPSVAVEVNRSVDLAAIRLRTLQYFHETEVNLESLEMTQPNQIVPLYSIFM